MSLMAYALGLMVGQRVRDEAYRPEGKKGVFGGYETQVEAVFWAVRAAQEAALIHEEEMAEHLG
jgi:hypothetical protein